MKLWISFCVPILNEKDKIGQMIRQFKQQTDQNFELVIVDGGSKDGTLEVIKRYQKNMKQLKLYNELGEFKSTGNARTQAILNSKGEYVLIVDSDVNIGNKTVKKINDILKKNKKYDMIIIGCRIMPPRNVTPFFYRDNWIEGGKIIIKRNIHPGFHRDCSFREDKLFYERINISDYKILKTNEKIDLYHYGITNYDDFIKRYKWYGRTSLEYFKNTKYLKNKIQMILVWISIPIFPLGILIGLVKGSRMIWRFIKNHIYDANLLGNLLFMEFVSVFAFSYGFLERILLSNKKKSRE